MAPFMHQMSPTHASKTMGEMTCQRSISSSGMGYCAKQSHGKLSEATGIAVPSLIELL